MTEPRRRWLDQLGPAQGITLIVLVASAGIAWGRMSVGDEVQNLMISEQRDSDKEKDEAIKAGDAAVREDMRASDEAIRLEIQSLRGKTDLITKEFSDIKVTLESLATDIKWIVSTAKKTNGAEEGRRR